MAVSGKSAVIGGRDRRNACAAIQQEPAWSRSIKLLVIQRLLRPADAAAWIEAPPTPRPTPLAPLLIGTVEKYRAIERPQPLVVYLAFNILSKASVMTNPLEMDRRIEPNNTYVERLQKLIPIEITALFIFISKLGTKTQYEPLLGILLLVLILAIWPYVGRFQHVTSSIQKIIIIVSFVLWSSYTDPDLIVRLLERIFDSQEIFDYLNPTPLGMIVAVWTFLIPLITPATRS